MRIGTIMSVAVLAASTAALTQVVAAPTKPVPGNNASMPMNSTEAMPTNDTMNTHDETMINDSSTPNSTAAPK